MTYLGPRTGVSLVTDKSVQTIVRLVMTRRFLVDFKCFGSLSSPKVESVTRREKYMDPVRCDSGYKCDSNYDLYPVRADTWFLIDR